MTRWFKDDECVDYYSDEEISKALSCYDKLKKELSELDGWLDADDARIKYFIENTLGVEK